MLIIMDEQIWFVSFFSFLLVLSAFEYLWSSESDSSNATQRWPANIGLGFTNSALVALVPAGAVWWAGWALQHHTCLLNWLQPPFWLALVLTFAAYTFAQYGIHRLSHSVPMLWRVHKVHHSDPHLDGTTALRNHPLELLVRAAFMFPWTIAFGFHPVAVALVEAVEIIASIATHTSLQLPQRAEVVLRKVLVTPGVHRLHHSDYQVETDSNFGAVLTIWDRLFGTFLAEPVARDAAFKIGLTDVDPMKAAQFEWLIFLPLPPSRSTP